MYECRITFIVSKNQDLDELDEQLQAFGWHHSVINGNPVLGHGAKHYATKNFENIDAADAKQRMRNTATQMEALLAITVIRQKVEHIVYDSRYTDKQETEDVKIGGTN